jgi:hypothetical protein
LLSQVKRRTKIMFISLMLGAYDQPSTSDKRNLGNDLGLTFPVIPKNIDNFSRKPAYD